MTQLNDKQIKMLQAALKEDLGFDYTAERSRKLGLDIMRFAFLKLLRNPNLLTVNEEGLISMNTIETNLNLHLPDCDYVIDSDIYAKALAGAIHHLIESMAEGLYTQEKCEQVWNELSDVLVKVCDPGHQCELHKEIAETKK